MSWFNKNIDFIIRLFDKYYKKKKIESQNYNVESSFFMANNPKYASHEIGK